MAKDGEWHLEEKKEDKPENRAMDQKGKRSLFCSAKESRDRRSAKEIRGQSGKGNRNGGVLMRLPRKSRVTPIIKKKRGGGAIGETTKQKGRGKEEWPKNGDPNWRGRWSCIPG